MEGSPIFNYRHLLLISLQFFCTATLAEQQADSTITHKPSSIELSAQPIEQENNAASKAEHSSYHNEKPNIGEDNPTEGKENETEALQIDATHKATSEALLTTADWIDSFFDDERYLIEENRSWARAGITVGYTKFDEWELKPHLDLSLKLPHLSRHTSLLISAYDEEDSDSTEEQSRAVSDSETDEIRATLRYLLKAGERYHISTHLGASTSHIYIGARYRYQYDFGPWQGRFTDRLRYYSDDGWESKATLDMERHFSKFWFFRNSLNLNWSEEEEGLPHSLLFQFTQLLSPRRALRYELLNHFDTHPNHHMTDLELIFRYRQRFYRDWLVLELTPQISFPKEYDRDPNPGFQLRLEAEFGYLGDKETYRQLF